MCGMLMSVMIRSGGLLQHHGSPATIASAATVHLVAGRRQVHAQQLAQAVVVVHHQDASRPWILYLVRVVLVARLERATY